MSYENLVEGSYQGRIVDWGLKEVEKVKQIQAFISFEAAGPDGQNFKMSWASFLLKKDGTVNRHTMETLALCGFKGKNITELTAATALNNKKIYDISVEKENNFWRVKWVNDPEAGPSGKVTDAKSLAGYDLSKFNAALVQEANQRPQIKNHAPGASNPPTVSTDDALSF